MLNQMTFSPVTEAVYKRIPRKVKIGGWLQAWVFQAALRRAYRRFAGQHSQWTAALFDEHFLSHTAGPILACYPKYGVLPSPTELALAWDSQLGPSSPAVRQRRIAELALAADDFLAGLEAELERYPL